MVLASLISGFIQWSQEIVFAFGYLGVFIIGFIGTVSIILPTPAFLAVFVAGSVLNPWLVGIIAGLGMAMGEVVGYGAGLIGKKVIEKKNKKWLKRAKVWFEKHGAFWIIILFSVSPLPDDIVGILAGMIKYDIKKFFLASLIGKIAMCMALAWGGFYGVQWVLSLFGV